MELELVLNELDELNFILARTRHAKGHPDPTVQATAVVDEQGLRDTRVKILERLRAIDTNWVYVKHVVPTHLMYW